MGKRMNPETNLKLARRNAAVVEKYATLVGVTPEKFLNRFLGDYFVGQFEDLNNGNAEEYLGNFTLEDRARAEHLAAWMLERFEKLGRGPEVKFEVEVIEKPQGKFRVVAAMFYRGQMCQVSGE
jgi:hypothetical protein